MFQSSPVPEDGCNFGMTCDITGHSCFNPHPSRRTGATSPTSTYDPARMFQSSPVPEDGCNGQTIRCSDW